MSAPIAYRPPSGDPLPDDADYADDRAESRQRVEDVVAAIKQDAAFHKRRAELRRKMGYRD